MGRPAIRKINTPAGPIEYELERKRVKNINLRIKPDGRVYVSASPYVSTAVIEGFIIRKADFIFSALRRFSECPEYTRPEAEFKSGEVFYILNSEYTLTVEKGSKNTAFISGENIIMELREPDSFSLRKRCFGKFFDALCLDLFSKLMDDIYPVFKPLGVPVPELKIRNMKSRWGSCMPSKAVITLNKKLLCAPEECVRYVITHEYCHFIHPDHSPAFHALMTELMPDWKGRKKLLTQCSQYWF